MKIEYQDQIDDYLNGRMSDTGRTEFEKDIQNNSELKEQLQFSEDLQKVLKSRNNILERMESWENERLSKAKKTSFKRIYYWASGIAALFLVGLFTFNTYFSPYLKSLWTKDTISDNNIKTCNKYEIIESLLENRDYEKALKQIEEREDELELKLGIMAPDTVSCVIIDSDEDVPIPDSSKANNDKNDKIDKNDNTSYWSEYEYVLWLEAQALIGLNRIEEATYVLNQLRTPNCKYETQADSLLKLLGR